MAARRSAVREPTSTISSVDDVALFVLLAIVDNLGFRWSDRVWSIAQTATRAAGAGDAAALHALRDLHDGGYLELSAGCEGGATTAKGLHLVELARRLRK